jgi:hypothetical protein
MQKIWDWAKDKLATEEIKNEMLLRSDNEGSTTWHLTACVGKINVLKGIWEVAKEKLITGEIKN